MPTNNTKMCVCTEETDNTEKICRFFLVWHSTQFFYTLVMKIFSYYGLYNFFSRLEFGRNWSYNVRKLKTKFNLVTIIFLKVKIFRYFIILGQPNSTTHHHTKHFIHSLVLRPLSCITLRFFTLTFIMFVACLRFHALLCSVAVQSNNLSSPSRI